MKKMKLLNPYKKTTLIALVKINQLTKNQSKEMKESKLQRQKLKVGKIYFQVPKKWLMNYQLEKTSYLIN